MGSDNRNTVVQRKAQIAREEYQARAMSPVKALRLGLAQSADDLFGLPLTVATVEQTQITQSDVPGAFADQGLIVLLDGSENTRGAVQMDRACLGALIEIQTTGRLTGKPPEDRAITRTDAAIAAPLIDATLNRFEELLEADGPHHWAAGHRFGAMIEDARALNLAVQASAFHLFKINLEIGDTAVFGIMTLMFPVRDMPKPKETGRERGEETKLTLEQSAMGASIVLQAVLARTTVTLERICEMKAGDRISFSSDQPLIANLEISGRHPISRARVGQLNGLRAVRLLGGDATHTSKDHDEDPPVSPAPSILAGDQKIADIGDVSINAQIDLSDLNALNPQKAVDSTADAPTSTENNPIADLPVGA